MARLDAESPETGRVAGHIATVAFVTGGLLLVWSGSIHFHLWQSGGYRHIATIGPLFLVQSVAAVVLGVAVVVTRRAWVALLGAGFALSTVGGFLFSVERGLFGFQDSWSAPFAHEAFVVEIAAVLTLGSAAAVCIARTGPARRRRRVER